ncbi:MAG: phospholipase D-like domain-containing protein [Candidatus Alcyoniella australis]|nr:phospholipase D-like domain-containing protein [Candidatus Alcyoniella australis]
MAITLGADRIELFRNGRELYPRMLGDIERAQRAIHWEMYIFADDPVGELFRDALARRAAAGVEVLLLVDALGSLGTPSTFFDSVRRAGGTVRFFNPLALWRHGGGRYRALPWDRRDHRKLLVIDHELAYVGGINLGNQFLHWEDLQLRVEGPGAARLAESFQSVWRADPRILFRRMLEPYRSTSRLIDVLDGFPAPDYSPIKKAYVSIIKRARSTLWLSQSYFFPSRKLRRELAKAVARGVDVRLMLPAHSDIYVVEMASRRLYAKLLKQGVRIYLYEPTMLHTKWACVDGRQSIVGSANLDPVSLFHTLEIDLLIRSEELAAQLEELFKHNIERCRALDFTSWSRRPWLDRLRERLWYRLRRFFYYS